MRNVVVVSGFVPLEVKHLSAKQYHEYAEGLKRAIPHNQLYIFDHGIEELWLLEFLRDIGGLHYPPATAVPADRYATPGHMVMSNIVQHQRTTWLRRAASLNPRADVLVWLDYAILKQGDFTGKRVTEQHVADFVRAVAEYDLNDIPFPGCWPKGEVSDTGDNWRFVGSTHVIPRDYLKEIDQLYKHLCRGFILRTKTVPLDLPIWALVEQCSDLPFRQYVANHDATQLTEFPRA